MFHIGASVRVREDKRESERMRESVKRDSFSSLRFSVSTRGKRKTTVISGDLKSILIPTSMIAPCSRDTEAEGERDTTKIASGERIARLETERGERIERQCGASSCKCPLKHACNVYIYCSLLVNYNYCTCRCVIMWLLLCSLLYNSSYT